MRKQTYERIRSLTEAMQREPKVNSRRKYANDLISFLYEDENRKKLSQEATPSNTPNGRSAEALRCQALAQLWRVILQAAINFVNGIVASTKVKLTLDDVSVPFRLLAQCDKKDEAFDQPNYGIPRLSKPTARMMLNFCLNMLADEKAVEVAEKGLLDMLNHMCSRPLYVASFRHRSDLSNILQELKERMNTDMEKRYNEVFVKSAKVFDSLFSTCRLLDIQIYHLLYDSIELVSGWCKDHLKAQTVKTAAVVVFPNFFNAVASMILSCPDHAVAPMKRFGRPMLSCAKQFYSAAVGISKDALNNYLYAHILVAEAAGRVQGMSPGDLGNLGRATLSSRHIMEILSMAIEDMPRVLYGSVDAVSKKQRAAMRGRHFKWEPLEHRARQHLELCAKLMSCAQRTYYLDFILTQAGGLEKDLIALLKEPVESTAKESPKTYPIDVVGKSPWVRFIVGPVYRILLGQYSKESGTQGPTQPEQAAIASSSTSHPILGFLVRNTSDTKLESESLLLSRILPMIGACAELCPAGQCWSSKTHWHHLPTESRMPFHQSASFQSCDPSDLVLIIYLLADILVLFGGASGDVQVQSWALTVLLRLTETTSAILRLFSGSPTALQSISQSWQRVWNVLFRSDLRYSSYTNLLSRNSLGELVLLLITELVDSKCTCSLDAASSSTGSISSFVSELQHQVWKLPAFTNHRTVDVTAPFELVYTMTTEHPLSEKGSDNIGATTLTSDISEFFEAESNQFPSIAEVKGRRYRLLRFVLARLDRLLKECVNKKEVSAFDDRYASILTACVISLVHGKDAYLVTSFKFNGEPVEDDTTPEDYTNDRLFFTDSRSRLAYDPKDKSVVDPNPLECLFEPLSFGTHFLRRSSPGWTIPSDQGSTPFEQSFSLLSAHMIMPKHRKETFLSDASSRDLRWRLRRCLNAWLNNALIPGFEVSSPGISPTAVATNEDESSVRIDKQLSLSSSWHCLVLKVSLGIYVSCKEDDVHDELVYSQDKLPELLENMTSRLMNGKTSLSEFLTITTSLLQAMRSFVEMSLWGTHKAAISSAVISLQKACKQLLAGYEYNGRKEAQDENPSPSGKRPSSSSSQSNRMSLDDDDDDDGMMNDFGSNSDLLPSQAGSVAEPSGKRRGPSSLEESRKKRRLNDAAAAADSTDSIAAPNTLCAIRLSSILLALDPSLPNCQFVCSVLLGSNFTSDAESDVVDMNYLSALFCCEFLCSEEVLLHESTKDMGESLQELDVDLDLDISLVNSGPVAMLCRIIEAIRSIEDPSSPLCVYGSRQLVRAIEICEGQLRKHPIQNREAQMVIRLLDPSTGIKGKLTRQMEKIFFALRAFEAGNRSFRQYFAKEFVANFIKPSFHSLYGSIRFAAQQATAVALRFLDEDKIIESVSSQLTAPLSIGGDDKGMIDAYSAWFGKMVFLSSFDEDKSLKKTDALDFKERMEMDSIFCKAMISASTQSEATFLRNLFGMICVLKQKPELEFPCFCALDATAAKRQYQKAEIMIAHHSEAILQLWIGEGNLLSEIPLLVSAPSTLRRIMEMGCVNAVNYGPQTTTSVSILNILTVRKQACVVFASKFRRFAVPVILIQAIQLDNESSASKNRQFNDACDLLACEDNIEVETEVQTRMYRDHVQDIQSFVYVLLASENLEYKDLAASLMDRMSVAIPDNIVKELTQLKSNDIIRQILVLSGKWNTMLGFINLDEITFFNAINMFIESNCAADSTKGDVLFLAGTNITACLIKARLQMDQSILFAHPGKFWIAIKILIQFVLAQLRKQDYECSQLGFCVFVLLDVILDNRLRELRASVLGLLRELLDASLKSLKDKNIKAEVLSFLERLIGVCVCVHEESQKDLVSFCSGKYRNYFYKLQRSTGLARLLSGHLSGAWGWDESDFLSYRPDGRQDMAIARFANRAPNELCEVLTSTYQMYELVTGRSISSYLGEDTFAHYGPSSALEPALLRALQAVNAQFSIQALVQKMNEQSNHARLSPSEQIGLVVKSLENKLSDRQSWVSLIDGNTEKGRGNGMNIDQQLLYSILLQLERLLNERNRFSLKSKDFVSLLRSLTSICSVPCPRDLRVTASRCLGELDIPTEEHIAVNARQSDNANAWIDKAITRGNLLLALKARCITILSRCLKSPPAIAMTATDILEVLFAKNEIEDCWDLISDSSCKILMRPFFQVRKQQNGNCLELSNFEITQLMEESGVVLKDGTNKMWCWENVIWKCTSSSSSFESWLCRLVPAIIVCCLRPQATDDTDGLSQTRFLWLCQKLCRIEHEFCASLFPLIVLELLGRDSLSSQLIHGRADDDDDEAFGVFDYNYLLSRAFTTLMTDSSHDAEVRPNLSISSKALALVIDTLDLLRKVSQHAFMTSNEHQRNMVSLSNRSYNDQRLKKKWDDEPALYNVDIPPPQQWDGLPYGTILRLDGLLVARSCVTAHRYVSAVFFVELFFNSILGGSGGVLQHGIGSIPSNNYSPTLDISGLSRLVDLPPDQSLECENIEQMSISAIKILEHCYHHLHENEVLDALSGSLPLFNSSENALFSSRMTNSTLPPLQSLQKLDGMPRLLSNGLSSSLQVASHLEDLQLRQLLQMYINGLTNRIGLQSVDDDVSLQALKEKWYENYISSHQWHDKFLAESTGDFSTVVQAASDHRFPHFPISSNNRSGFFESFHSALLSFAQDNIAACASHIENSRWQILDSILGGEEPLSVNIATVMDQLHSISDVQFLISLPPCSEILNRWSLPDQPAGNEHPLISSYLSSSMSGCVSDASTPLTLTIRENLLDILCMKHGIGKEESRRFHSGLILSLWNTSQIDQQKGLLASAESSLCRLASVLDFIPGDPTSAPLVRIKIEEASILKKRGEVSMAIQKMNQIVGFLQDETKKEGETEPGMDELLVDAYVLCGKWMTNHKMQQAKTILDSYFLPGKRLSQSIYNDNRCLANARRCTTSSIALAQLVASLYESLSSRTASAEWKSAGDALKDQEEEVERCRLLSADARKRYLMYKNRGNVKEMNVIANEINDIDYFYLPLEKDTKRTRLERESVEASTKKYVNTAIQSFATALALADTGSSENLSRHVFRMVSLWFSGHESSRLDADTVILLSEIGERIPSFRFVPLTSQIFSRIDSVEGSDPSVEFQHSLQKLVFKLCEDHPYHTIVQLIALANGRNVGSGVGGRNATAFLENVGEGKVVAAEAIIDKLKKSAAPYIGKLLYSYKLLIDAYICLANAPTEEIQKTKTKNIAFSEVCSTPKLSLDVCLGGRRNKVECPPCIVTAPPDLRPGCDYGEGEEDPIGGERISSFVPHFSITETGLHRPKIVVCIGSQGRKFRQLAKGGDEIRQDAVMSQVFKYVNGLVSKRDGASSTSKTDSQVSSAAKRSKRQLNVVTYNIIPLSPASGVLEWVENTMPFGDYMTDKRLKKNDYVLGAHSRYYPDEWGQILCRSHLMYSPPSVRRQSFDEIYQHHSPVFRFFFVERFGHSLQAWYTARMKYISSVAVSSIVGHILGIGDRHGSNILVHQKSGEVVHIDFGIVFDQGKLLRTPERVPFRLTRNMVDAMGPSGTDGIFTRVAEETLHLLKDNADALLTILSAIVSDPLYKWSISPVKAQMRQAAKDEDAEDRYALKQNENKLMLEDRCQNESHNEAGAKAISKIKEKLQGYEDGTSGEQQSVEGQVQLLINSAIDPDNLCQMFVGWSPWM